ncbi:MAG: hypothetical protein SF028_12315 [Candidatus Sumerlaeia bacterium]|nr:hypothetical protein [Candidatus Sumerlaeia bacterium]
MTPPPRARAAQIAAALAGVPAVAWIALHVVNFWRTNPPLWSGPPDLPHGVWSALFLPWQWWGHNVAPWPMAQALLAAALTHILGLMLLTGAQVYARGLARHGLAFTLGVGASGLLFELLAMAHLLTPWPVRIAWLAMLGGAGWWASSRAARPVARWWNPPGADGAEAPGRLDHPDWHERHWRANFLADTLPPDPAPLRFFTGVALVLAAAITALTFWHALALPESYWDSLILYLGYARMTFLEGGFPFKAEAQVGIGLGANYPHLYPTYGAASSALFGEWNELHLRFAAPLAAMWATAMLYGALLLATRSRPAAAAGALLFRLTPNAVFYSTYASDYAFSFLFVAALALAVACFAKMRTLGALAVLFAIPAAASHLNYLMVTLWGPAVLGVAAGLWNPRPLEAPPAPAEEPRPAPPPLTIEELAADDPDPAVPPGPPLSPDAPGPLAIFANRKAWIIFLVFFALGGTWFARNYFLTGNPVYSFFPEIFTKSVRVNTDVLRSAEIEWFRNGDGIGRLAEQHRDLAAGREPRDPYAEGFRREAALADRLSASWRFWSGGEPWRFDADGDLRLGGWGARLRHLASGSPPNEPGARGVLEWPHAYKMNPTFAGFLPPGLLVGAAVLGAALARRRGLRPELVATTAAMGLFLAGFLAYMYLIADFYLYQIVSVTVAGGYFSALALWALLRTPGRWARAGLVVAYSALLGASALVPGVAMAMMNAKLIGEGVVSGQRFSQTRLDALRNPGLPPEIFHRVVYGEEPAMWEYVNTFLKDQRLLTHENRHYVFDPSITLVHLDDWAVQQGWGLATPEETAGFLSGLGLRFYLYIPNEDRHEVNRRLGMRAVVDAGIARKILQAGDSILYEIPGPSEAPGDSPGMILELRQPAE